MLLLVEPPGVLVEVGQQGVGLVQVEQRRLRRLAAGRLAGLLGLVVVVVPPPRLAVLFEERLQSRRYRRYRRLVVAAAAQGWH